MQRACGEAGPGQNLLRQILARFLGKHCPSSHQVSKGIISFHRNHLIGYSKKLTGFYFVAQLAMFLAAKRLLNPETAFAVLKLIAEQGQGQGKDKENAGVSWKMGENIV